MPSRIILVTDGMSSEVEALLRARLADSKEIVVVQPDGADQIPTLAGVDTLLDLRRCGGRAPYAKAAQGGIPFTLLLDCPWAGFPVSVLSRRQTHFLSAVGNHPDLLMLRLKLYGMRPTSVTLQLHGEEVTSSPATALYRGLQSLHALVGSNDMRTFLRERPAFVAHPDHGMYRMTIAGIEYRLMLSAAAGPDQVLAILADGSEYQCTLQPHRASLQDLAINPRCWLSVHQALSMDALAARMVSSAAHDRSEPEYSIAV